MQMVHGVGAVRPRRQVSPSTEWANQVEGSRSPSPTLRRSPSPAAGGFLPSSTAMAHPGAALVATPARTGMAGACSFLPGRSVCDSKGSGANELVITKSGSFQPGGSGLDFLPQPGLTQLHPNDPGHWSNNAHAPVRPLMFSEGDNFSGMGPPDGARDRAQSPFGSPRLQSPGRMNRGRQGERGGGTDTPRFGSPMGLRAGADQGFDFSDFEEAAAAARRRVSSGRANLGAAGPSRGRSQQRVEVRDSVDEAEECPVTCCGLDGGGRKAGTHLPPDGNAPRPIGYGEDGGRLHGSCWTRRG